LAAILFNLDKTLIDGRVMDVLALHYKFYYDLNRLRTNLRNGLLSHKGFVKSQIKLLKGKQVKNIIEVIRNIPLMPNTKKVLNNLRNEGLKLGIIEGPDIVTNDFVEQLKLDYSVGHRVEIIEGRLTGKIRLLNDNGKFLEWKKESIKEIKTKTNHEIIAVGNDELDAPMLKEADFGIAFNPAYKSKIKRAADVVIKKKDMNMLLKTIDSYLNGEPHQSMV